MSLSLSSPKSFSGGAPIPEPLHNALRRPAQQLGCPSPLARAKPIDLTEGVPAWAPRNQGARGTCTAFVAAHCVELMEARRTGRMVQFSPEHNYWHMRDGKSAADFPGVVDFEEGATKFDWAAEALASHGIATEASAPYITDPDKLKDGLFAHKKPTAKAEAEAANYIYTAVDNEDFGFTEEGSAGAQVPEKIYAALAAGRPVGLTVPIFRMAASLETNWTNPGTRLTGIVPYPDHFPADITRDVASSHAVCVTGYQPPQEGEHAGWFIFKNSWNGFFGQRGGTLRRAHPFVPAIGFGALSEDYVRTSTVEYASFARAEGCAAV